MRLFLDVDQVYILYIVKFFFSKHFFVLGGRGVYKYSPSYEMEMQGLGLRDGNRRLFDVL